MLTVSAADYAASLVSWLALVPTQTLDDFHAFIFSLISSCFHLHRRLSGVSQGSLINAINAFCSRWNSPSIRSLNELSLKLAL